MRNSDDKLCRFLLMLVSVLFILRPATVWAFQPGDVCCVQIPSGVAIVCISRSVKRRPELLSAPNRREIVVYDDDCDSPLGRIATAILRVQHVRWDWCCQVSREAPLQKDGSAVLTRWLREAVGNNLRLPPGRRLSSYSLRIMGASAASAAGRDINWIRLWGLWKTPLQVYTYIQDDYGHSEYATSLFSFGKPRSGGADYVRGRDPAPQRQLEQSAAAGSSKPFSVIRKCLRSYRRARGMLRANGQRRAERLNARHGLGLDLAPWAQGLNIGAARLAVSLNLRKLKGTIEALCGIRRDPQALGRASLRPPEQRGDRGCFPVVT